MGRTGKCEPREYVLRMFRMRHGGNHYHKSCANGKKGGANITLLCLLPTTHGRWPLILGHDLIMPLEILMFNPPAIIIFFFSASLRTLPPLSPSHNGAPGDVPSRELLKKEGSRKPPRQGCGGFCDINILFWPLGSFLSHSEGEKGFMILSCLGRGSAQLALDDSQCPASSWPPKAKRHTT